MKPIPKLTMAQAGALGGKVRSKRKSRAVRRNGYKGGRPRKIVTEETP